MSQDDKKAVKAREEGPVPEVSHEQHVTIKEPPQHAHVSVSAAHHLSQPAIQRKVSGGVLAAGSGDAVVEDGGTITFQKRIVPKQRTQSVQSVLSSVSLRSFVNQHNRSQVQLHQSAQVAGNNDNGTANNNSNSKSNINSGNIVNAANGTQPSQEQFISAKTHIQAPAAAASSKRKASFEIGQRLPFNQDDERSVEESAVSNSGDEGDSSDSTEQNKNLTDDALKKLSNFAKFQPAEVDMSMRTTTAIEDYIPRYEPAAAAQQQDQQQPELQQQSDQDSTHPLLSRNSSQRQLTLQPQPHRVVSQSRVHQISQPHSLSPSISQDSNHSSRQQSATHAQQLLLSQTTSSQDLRTFQPSPTSFLDNANLKTINDPKRPMYVPAVLRQSNTNLKPEDVKHINEQNSRKSKNVISDAAHSLKSQTSHWKLGFDNNNKLPTRAHWRRDVTRNSCAYCDVQFTFFERRHHCRRCGDIFCAQHTSHLLKLGPDAQFTLGGSGVLCKVCDRCTKDYEDFYKSKFGDNSLARKSSVIGVDDNTRQNGNTDSVNGGANGAIVGSVPADWSWSSF